MLVIEKKYLVLFYLALKATDGVLSLKEARTRDLMLKPLFEVTKTFEEDRNKIYAKYGELKDDKYEFQPETTEDVVKETNELLVETVELPTVPGIKDILERTEYKPKEGEAALIDEILAKL